MKINYKLKKIYQGIYLVTIKDQYDLGMTFCRLQEFYESPIKEIRGKSFSMTYFQRLYAKRHGHGAFTYPRDWAGFNIPDSAIKSFMSTAFEDWGNLYDNTIEEIHESITLQHSEDDASKPYYIIAAEPKHKETIEHELCHALYYLNPTYRTNVDVILSELNCVTLANFRAHLLKMGYSKSVMLDEINAYACIDPDHVTDMVKMNKKESKNFHMVQRKLKSLFTYTIKELE
jgi:hypothetical protein